MDNSMSSNSSGNGTSIFDMDSHLAIVLGPKRLPLNWLIPLTTIYSIIFFSGLIGNACTCLVIARNQYMQTATNCYLFNLAIADMLTLVCAMPFELYTLWHQYPWELGNVVCEMRAIISEATAYASILTIVTFTTEQYIAVCHPLRQTVKSKVSRAIRNIIIIWLLSLFAATPYGIFSRVNYLTIDTGKPIEESAWCGFPFNDPNSNWETLLLCSTFLFFVVPMTLISFLYIRIAMTLHHTRTLHRSASEAGATCRGDGQRAKIQSRRIIVRMLITVVIAFFFCWAPFHSQRLLFVYVTLYGKWTETLRKINQDLYTLAGCFYYSNSTINPILYNVMSNRFRVAFREKLCAGNPCTWLLCCCCCCWKWWRDKFQSSHKASSCRDSNPTSSPHSHLGFPLKHAVVPKLNSCPRVQSIGKEAEDQLLPPTKWQGNSNYTGASHSEGKREESYAMLQGYPIHPRYNSDPNFSLRMAVSRCRDFSTDDSDPDLANELASAIQPELAHITDGNTDCVSCTNCNLFQSKPRLTLYNHLGAKSSNSDLTSGPGGVLPLTASVEESKV